MSSNLGMHWMRVHPDGRDLDHIAKMQYKSVKLFEWHWSDADACANLLSVLPRDSYILARDHPLSEQEIWSDPLGIGTRHANEWADKVHSGRYKLPTDRSFFLGRNEPDATTGNRNAIDLYTEAFLRRLAEHGLRGGGFNFSTGHPRTVDGTGNTAADYSVFERSHQAIVAGHHIGVLHIYGTAAVPCAPGHYDRLKACPWQDVQWVVGEMGSDEYVVGGGKHDGFMVPFNGHLGDYCAWLDTLIIGINDSRIHSYQVFTYDFSHPWSSFNVREIRDALESYQWRHMQDVPKPAPVIMPPIDTGTKVKTMYVTAPAGLNLRSAPRTGNILVAIPHAAAVEIIETEIIEGAPWSYARYGAFHGWLFTPMLSATKPQPVPDDGPQPTPQGDNWTRSRAFVRRWEGGYQNNPQDKGNWTGCEVGRGENRGTKYGISACSYPHLDIPNLSMAQADAIYEQDYWRASGADKLPWPYCLLVFDTAVLHGVGAARKWQAEVGNNVFAFAAKRLRVYIHSDNWQAFAAGWINRAAELLEEMGK